MDPNFDTRMLRVADTHPEDLVAGFELRYVSANRFDQASQVNAWPRDLWFSQPDHRAEDVRHTFQVTTVQWIDGSRADLYQDLIALRDRLLEIFNLKNIG
jgi:hypothetical protein